jgi:hypothetical protein
MAFPMKNEIASDLRRPAGAVLDFFDTASVDGAHTECRRQIYGGRGSSRSAGDFAPVNGTDTVAPGVFAFLDILIAYYRLV